MKLLRRNSTNPSKIEACYSLLRFRQENTLIKKKVKTCEKLNAREVMHHRRDAVKRRENQVKDNNAYLLKDNR